METKGKIYLVTAGSYSEYRIICACSTMEKAEEARFHSNADDIEEFDVDTFVHKGPKGMRGFSASMNEDGNRAKARAIDTTDHGETPNNTTSICQDFDGVMMIFREVWAYDEEHAIKILNEHRTAAIIAGDFDKERQRIQDVKDEEERKEFVIPDLSKIHWVSMDQKAANGITRTLRKP